MAAPQQLVEKKLYTEDEYYAFSETAEERWEFTPAGPPGPDGSRLGRIRVIAGGTVDHATIISNVAFALHDVLVPRGTRVLASNMRYQAGDGKKLFPDVSVVCGRPAYYAGRRDTLTNPTLIVEVLSPSTAIYDAGAKFGHYQTMPTLRDYLLVFRDEVLAILHSRAGDHWETRLVAGADGATNLSLPSVGVTLALADVYALVEFEGDGVESEGPDGDL